MKGAFREGRTAFVVLMLGTKIDGITLGFSSNQIIECSTASGRDISEGNSRQIDALASM